MSEELRYRFTGDATNLVRANARVGDSFDAVGDDARKLDGEIADLRESIRVTAVAWSRAADEVERKSIFKSLAAQKRALGQRITARDLIDFKPDEAAGIGARMAAALGEGVSRAGGPIADALGNVFGALPPQAQAALGAGVVAAVTATAPAVGAVVAGAVTGGIAAGGVAAGIALAARDARVKAAADGLGDTILDALSRSAAPAFVPPTLRAITDIRLAVRDLDDEFDDVFGAAAAHVDPFVDGLIGAGKAALPGFTEALRNAGPVVEQLGAGMVRLGGAVGDAVGMMSNASVGGAAALKDLFTVLEFGVRGTAAMVTGLSFLYEGLRLVTGAGTAHTEIIAGHAVNAAAAKGPLDGLATAFEAIAEEQDAAAATGRDLLDVWNEFFGAVMSGDQALLRYEESWDRLIEELNDGKRTLDTTTEAGQDNMRAVLDQVDAINGLYQAGVINDAQYRTHLGTLEAALTKRGFEAGAVQRVIDKYRAIPDRVTTVLSNNAEPAASRVEAYIRKLGDIPDSKTVTIYQRLVSSGVRISGLTGPGGVTAFSKGGPVRGPGPRGVDSVLSILAPGEGVLTDQGLERLGGERALEALNRGTPLPAAASGASPVPALAGSRTYAITVNVPPMANPADAGRAVVEAIQAYEQRNGTHWRAGP